MSIKLGRNRWSGAAVAAVATSALVLGGAPAANAAGEHDGHEGGGDACTFFLEHMWANEDGIPLLGSPAHLNEYHTDPTYDNLILSLASGAIGNSEMPVIDIYGGPLGWIPVFNPSHVKGHGTDYVTLLTSCGGIGIPLDSNDLTTLNVPSVEELADLSTLIMPGLPSPEMLTDPEYLWKTTDASAILDRVTLDTLLDTEEYLGFAGDHFDTWRLLWETALEDVSNGNPTGILEVLKITDNIHTLESLSGVLGGDIAENVLGQGGLTDLLGDDPTSDLLGDGGVAELLGPDALAGLLGDSEITEVIGKAGLTELLGDDAVTGLLGPDALADVLSGDAVTGVLGADGLTEVLSGDAVTGVLGQDGLESLLSDDAIAGLLGDDAISGLLGGGGLLGGLLGGGGDGGLLGGGLLGGGDDPVADATKYSVLLTGSADSSAAAQCQGSLNGSALAVTCVYSGMSSAVTDVTLETAAGDLQLESTGGTSGGAVGSFELTSEQISALNSGEATVSISTEASADSELSGVVTPCE